MLNFVAWNVKMHIFLKLLKKVFYCLKQTSVAVQ